MLTENELRNKPVKTRLDVELVKRRMVSSRSQAESYIKLSAVKVNGKVVNKAGTKVLETDRLEVETSGQYVSRAGLKLASVAEKLNLNFKNKAVLDVGSSTGGFTDFALQNGASKVIAVDVGTNQLHPKLREDPRVELHEKTDIRNFVTGRTYHIVLIDVSFISLREILPAVAELANKDTHIVAMLKPQFEAGKDQINKGIIKNDTVRRAILKDFESWVKQKFMVTGKADSAVAGSGGNHERFYLLKIIPK